MKQHHETGYSLDGSVQLRKSESQVSKIIADMKSFSLDVEGASRPFSKKLQEQQLWTENYAMRAIEEYKRFMVLAAISATEVTPSQAVDQVWHLHLQYTKSYAEMCKNILGKFIDHNPGAGAPEDERQYSEQYLKTLLLYSMIFNEAAPHDLWPLSGFDQGSLKRGVSTMESRKGSSDSSQATGDDSTMFVFLNDTSFPERPLALEMPRSEGSQSNSNLDINSRASEKGFFSQVWSFFTGSSSETQEDRAGSSPAAEVDRNSGISGFFESLGFGGSSDSASSSSSDSSSCSSASSCGGSSCGGGGCGGD